ncbi:hypothetical protein OH76DRAFT_1420890 [Lentinus brumalis]|uniref:F-box domain-containing protein n=1 Tax=Lentinus brumalis TaxID=2498619 RepID=A0A371CYD5_9APHY|nr:hypothetical protein OH76DRAFT_1420890 [Polyporus brumalis]
MYPPGAVSRGAGVLTKSSIPPDVEHLIADHLDINTVLDWRTVCPRFREQANAALRNMFRRIIRYYVRDANAFVEMLRQFGAIVAGQSALAFFLRDVNVLGTYLYVCCTDNVFDDLVDGLQMKFTLNIVPESPRSRGGKSSLRYLRTPNGRCVAVEKFTMHPFEGLVRSSNTALMNFVGADVFGSAYACLTLNREGMIYDWWSSSREQRISAITLVANGFQFTRLPWSHLPGYITKKHWGVPSCLAAWYMCPCQPRFMGDAGCLFDSFDGDAPGEDLMFIRDERGRGLMMRDRGRWRWYHRKEGDGGLMVHWWWPGQYVGCYGSTQKLMNMREYSRGPQPMLRRREEVPWRGRGLYPAGKHPAEARKEPFPRIPADVELAIADRLDLYTLLDWRLTCPRFKEQANIALRNMFRQILGCFVRDPRAFIEVLRRYSAVVAGRAALAFFLRDLRVVGRDMYVTCNVAAFDDFLEELQSRCALQLLPVWGPGAGVKGVKYLVRYLRAPNGTSVVVEASEHPFVPLVYSPTTALVNFVGADIFGSAYPSLTMNREGIAYPFRSTFRDQKIATLMLLANNFRFAHSAWDLIPGLPTPPATMGWSYFTRRYCLEPWYLCPCQPRFFGDGGCLIDSFDGSPPSEELMYIRRDGEGGVMVQWWWPGYYVGCEGRRETISGVPRSYLALGQRCHGEAEAPFRQTLIELSGPTREVACKRIAWRSVVGKWEDCEEGDQGYQIVGDVSTRLILQMKEVMGNSHDAVAGMCACG